MTDLQKNALWCKVKAVEMRSDQDTIALGYLRYEALRKLTGFQFTTLLGCVAGGENFDNIVDNLITGGTIFGGAR